MGPEWLLVFFAPTPPPSLSNVVSLLSQAFAHVRSLETRPSLCLIPRQNLNRFVEDHSFRSVSKSVCDAWLHPGCTEGVLAAAGRLIYGGPGRCCPTVGQAYIPSGSDFLEM